MTIEKDIKSIRAKKNITTKDISSAVREAVEIQINGNLREIRKIQTTQGETLVKITDHLLTQDETLKRLDEKIQPAVQSFSWIMTAGKVIMWISIAIGSVGGAILILRQFV